MIAFTARQLQMERLFHGSLHLRRLGAENPPATLLYIHGLGESALCFERLMVDARLSAWSHLAVDLIGYGKSGWAAEALTLEEHAARLAQLVGELGPGRPVVVGHSMGGVIGTLLCERLREQIAGFVNVEGNISPPDCGFSSQAVRFAPDAWLSHGFDEVLDNIYLDEAESAVVRRAYGASIQMCDPRAFHRNSEELVAFSRQEALAGRMAELAVPGVYVRGLPRGSGERSLRLLREAGVETVAIEASGHWPFLDQHEAFVSQLVEFLTGPAAGEGTGS
ncbi:MAG: alpha/beta hydrolase [Acidobacteriota bacterium]